MRPYRNPDARKLINDNGQALWQPSYEYGASEGWRMYQWYKKVMFLKLTEWRSVQARNLEPMGWKTYERAVKEAQFAIAQRDSEIAAKKRKDARRFRVESY